MEQCNQFKVEQADLLTARDLIQRGKMQSGHLFFLPQVWFELVLVSYIYLNQIIHHCAALYIMFFPSRMAVREIRIYGLNIKN